MAFDLSALGIDRDSLEGQLGSLIADEVAPILGAAAADLKEFGLAIARDGVEAFVRRDDSWTSQLKGQLKLVVELQRIRVEEVADWDLAERVIGLVFKAGFAALGAVKP